jgi:hypothetical protein
MICIRSLSVKEDSEGGASTFCFLFIAVATFITEKSTSAITMNFMTDDKNLPY